MNSPRKVLLIDNAADRKERIKGLADQGYSVFPALKLDEARSRCSRGGYDLIVVHAEGQQEQATAFCDEIRRQCPNQLLLMSGDGGASRDYAVDGNLSSLVQAVDRLLENKTADLASAA